MFQNVLSLLQIILTNCFTFHVLQRHLDPFFSRGFYILTNRSRAFSTVVNWLSSGLNDGVIASWHVRTHRYNGTDRHYKHVKGMFDLNGCIKPQQMWQPLSLNIQTRILYRGVLDSKVHGANMGPTWGRQDPGGPHVGPMNFAICGVITFMTKRRRNSTGRRTVDKANHRFQGQVVISLYHRSSSKNKGRVFEIRITYEYNVQEMVQGSLQYNEKPSISHCQISRSVLHQCHG